MLTPTTFVRRNCDKVAHNKNMKTIISNTQMCNVTSSIFYYAKLSQ